MAAATIELHLRPLRYAGVALLGAAALAPLVGDPGIACPLRTLTGVPCPFCGMTRGITDLAHGDVAGALLLNPGSILLVAAAIALVFARRPRQVRLPAWSVVATIAALWVFQLSKLVTGQPL